MINRNYITVSELNFFLSDLVSGEALLKNMLLLGEAAGVSIRGNAMFLTIRDECAQIKGIIFDYAKTYAPSDGEKALFTGTPRFYQKGGELSFYVEKVEPFGKGKLYLELEERKARLKAEGLFAPEHKIPLPLYPKNIAVVTSLSGAVIRDIITTVRRYNYLLNILIVDVKVQGADAAKEIAEGLGRADAQRPDAIIIARGGGSFDDLMPFNDEALARAIYRAEACVISAVGHETDFTICDMAADIRAATPTAAAELVAYDVKELEEEIKEKVSRAGEALRNKLDLLSAKVFGRAKDVRFIIGRRLDALNLYVKDSAARAGKSAGDLLESKDRKLESLISSLSALNPASVLEKGYFRVTKDGKNITLTAELKAGDIFEMQGSDGKIEAVVR
jgi:exodeoxyribonuclease VII, large subunit